jgi:hypothetical protein
MLIKEQNVEECDATEDAINKTAGNIIIQLYNKGTK